MQTVTLYAEDFKTVHNTLCDLRHLSLRSRVDPEELQKIVEKFERGLQSAYKQDSEAFDRLHDLYRKVQQHWGLRSIWSLYEVGDLEAQHTYEGAKYVIYDQHWGEGGAVVREIKTEGAGHGTWIDLWRAADSAIRASGDDHHCFIEAFQPVADLPQHLRLTTGS